MLEIRQAKTDADIRSIAELATVIWHEHFIKILTIEQIDYMVEKFQSYKAISEAVQNDGYIYYMAFEDGNLCGYCGIHPENDGSVFISKVYVEATHRKKGIATKMIERVKSDNPGFTKLWLTVNRFNEGSITVYKKRGFEIVRTQVADIGNGFVMDDYIMEFNNA